MIKVVITGGSGFLAGHLIRQLQENADDIVAEIHTIDRKSQPSQLFDYKNGRIPVTHHCFDLLNESELECVLKNASVVFHLARKQFQYLISHDTNSLNDQYTRDNLKATESLVGAMLNSSVQNLIYLSCAYANVPCEDNFGNSEEIHDSTPSSFMLGRYGETRTKAELFARRKVGTKMANGKPFQATFLRSVLIYGEGETKIPLMLKQVAQTHGGCLPYLQGPSNGLLQYIYAGNLAAVMEENMRQLLETPERCSGEFLYCMDKTECMRFYEFASPVLNCFGMRLGNPASLIMSYARTLWLEFTNNEKSPPEFSLAAFRFLFVYAVGFSNRKQQLIFRYRPTNTQAELIKRTTNWISTNLVDSKQRSSVLRMG